MNSQKIDIRTNDGISPCELFRPPQPGKYPAVILYMDAFGVRPALQEMSSRFASAGFNVLLPNLYYRAGPQKPFDPATAFAGGPEKDRIMALYQSLDQEKVMADTAAWLDFLAKDAAVTGKVGCVGYCMGGAYALAAAAFFPDRVGAAASFHGARLATDKPDSPHLLAPKMKAEIYVGIAGLDTHFPPEEKQNLETALKNAGVKNTVDVYEGAKHGFAVTDHPVYDIPAAEKHWQQMIALFNGRWADLWPENDGSPKVDPSVRASDAIRASRQRDVSAI